MEQLAEQYKGKIKIVSMNIDVAPDTASTLGITAIPAVVFFKDGKEVGRMTGGKKEKIEAEIQKLLS